MEMVFNSPWMQFVQYSLSRRKLLFYCFQTESCCEAQASLEFTV